MFRTSNRWMAAMLGLVLAWFATTAMADEKKSDPVGTWKWSFTTQNGQMRESTMKITKDGDKYAVAMLGRMGRETKADKVEFKNGEISFEITRERQGQKFTSKYHGKIDGDNLKGKIEFGTGDNARSRDWEAKRQAS